MTDDYVDAIYRRAVRDTIRLCSHGWNVQEAVRSIESFAPYPLGFGHAARIELEATTRLPEYLAKHGPADAVPEWLPSPCLEAMRTKLVDAYCRVAQPGQEGFDNEAWEQARAAVADIQDQINRRARLTATPGTQQHAAE